MNVSEDHSQPETSSEDDLQGLLPFVQDDLLNVFSQRLNLSAYEVRSQLVEGTKLWQIAQDHGLTLVEIEEVLVDARKEALAQAQQQGRIRSQQVPPLDRHLHKQLMFEMESA